MNPDDLLDSIDGTPLVTDASGDLSTDDSSLLSSALGPSVLPAVDSTSSIASSTATSSSTGLGGLFNSLTSDASTLLGGFVSGVNTQQAISTANALRANGYTVPTNLPGLNGASSISSLLFIGVAIVVVFMLLK